MYDYIIVGAGSAGCVLANRLSANPNHKVLLLEAGGPDQRTEIHVPLAWSQTLKTEVDWNYETVPQAHLNGRRLYWPRGKTLGGTSAINAMIYMRGHPSDYDHWEELGNEGWSYEDVLPYFKLSEDNSRGANRYHGTGGPLSVIDPVAISPLSEAFVAAGRAIGMPYQADFNDEDQEGVGLYQSTIRNGKRCSSAVAFLRPALERDNLTVITHAHTTRILFEGRCAVGVQYLENGFPREARAQREVILAAGAVNTPQLLMLSGIGPADHLREQEIKVISDLPGVGANLQDHLVTGLSNYSTQPVSLSNAMKPHQVIRYLLTSTGMLQTNGAEVGAYFTVDSSSPAPDIQVHFLPGFFVNHGFTRVDGHGFALGITVARPKSRGTIRLQSANPLVTPLIDPQYFSDPSDLELLVAAFKRVRELVYSAPFDPYRGAELLPGWEVQSDDQIREYMKWQIETIYHPVGTCKMGHDEMGVVNERLQVHTLENLRIADASIMPTIPGGNTNAPTIMIGEKAAELILQTR
ncbi:MAG: choline dehydrogenase [Anaerolineae bacterium]|jgi:choline dehydrogenase|nr:choline dehydrogenase [Anaerolineae bacterium]